MSDLNILFLYLEHAFKTETKTSIGTFDNTLVADLLDADVGFPLAATGELLIERYSEDIGSVLTDDRITDSDGYSKTSSTYHQDFCVTNPNEISENVRLVSGDLVTIKDYDVLLVSHLWAYNPLITYLSEQYPEVTLIGIQEGSMQDVLFYSSHLQMEHRSALAVVDGYITENKQYDRYVREFVDEVLSITLPVPKRQFDAVTDRSERSDTICVGITTWNVDFSNFYTNILVVDALRNRGYDVQAELVGVKDYQKKMIGHFGELPFVKTIEYLEDGFYEALSEYRLAIHLTRRATAGRVSAECAGVGTPVIGNRHNDLQCRCFPELSIEPYRIDEAINLSERLLTDQPFYDRMTSTADQMISKLQDHRKLIDQLNHFVGRVHSE